jgi:hypothetical protein
MVVLVPDICTAPLSKVIAHTSVWNKVMEIQHQPDSIFLLGFRGLSSVHHPKFVHQMQSPPNHINCIKNEEKTNMQKSSSER